MSHLLCSLRADLVPVFSFGENDAYKQVIFDEGTVWRSLQKKLQKMLGFAPCLFFGSSWGIVPFSKPITTIGKFVSFALTVRYRLVFSDLDMAVLLTFL